LARNWYPKFMFGIIVLARMSHLSTEGGAVRTGTTPQNGIDACISSGITMTIQAVRDFQI
jgi:hypothetical protein